jgi:hypothetical protein
MKKAISALVSMWMLVLILPANAQNLPGKIVYSVPGMDMVEVRKNLVYRKDGPDELHYRCAQNLYKNLQI